MILTRRELIKLGLAAGTVLAVDSPFGALNAMELKEGSADYSPVTGKKLKAIPSACWQCVSRDGIIGYVEDGRLVKLEGNPRLPRTNGRICARGQGGIGQVYDPDRLLYPMRRVGKRGEGKWKRISWDEGLNEIAGRLKKLKDQGHPEKFMFHYGRMKASSSKIIKSYFLGAYGTGTIGNHTSICEAAKWTAQELTWGSHYDVNDLTNSKYIISFGANFFEAHTSHVPIAQRGVEAMAKGAKLVAFDVRLSNTMAKAHERYLVKSGTDGAIALAMAHVIMKEGHYDRDFIENWTNVTVDQLKTHLAKYTPQWAEKVSGVPAAAIRRIALEYATTKPSTVVSYRGLVQHYNGVEGERIVMMLEGIAGNMDVKGGRCKAVGPKWKNSFAKPKVKAKKLKILDGKGIPYSTHHVSHQVFKMIKDGSNGRPDLYMYYCYNPVYANGDVQENIDVLKDERMIPFVVAVDVAMSEASELADIILPDTNYLERWDWEDMVSYDQIPEYYIRQPLVKPLGQVRDFKDVCVDLAQRIGGNVAKTMSFKNAEEFVKDACEYTPGVKDAGKAEGLTGFEYMKKYGAWVPPNAKPLYKSYAKKLSQTKLKGTVVDEATGVIWKGKPGQKYGAKKSDYKKYVGQMVKGVAYEGFKPDKVSRSGKLEVYSNFIGKVDSLKAKGFTPMPSYVPVPEHEKMRPNELVLTTFKVNAQTHSRTQNCKLLSEIYHSNPAWIHPDTAKARGIKNGDKIRVKSPIGEIVIKARVTEGVHPKVIAISHHCGHWAYGRYASGKAVFPDKKDEKPWWTDHGVHPNWIIPNSPDPVAGALRWMDTVVKVEKA